MTSLRALASAHRKLCLSFFSVRFVIGPPEDCWNQLKPYIEELGVTHFVFRTHFLGMPFSNAVASMQLMAEELPLALHAAKPTPLEQITAVQH